MQKVQDPSINESIFQLKAKLLADKLINLNHFILFIFICKNKLKWLDNYSKLKLFCPIFK